MHWDAIAALADFVAAIGVIITLLYLARQIRDGVENERIDAVRHAARDYESHCAVVISDENASAFIKGLNDYRSLTAEERMKFDFCAAGFINLAEVFIYHADAGRVDEILEMYGRYLGPRLFTYPGARQWWHHGQKNGFAAYTCTAWLATPGRNRTGHRAWSPRT